MALARFTLNGTRHEVSRDVAQSRLKGVVPEAIREHAVQVNGVWYPVKQAFDVAVGVPRAQFISHTARRHLAALGFPLKGEIESRDGTPHVPTAPTSPPGTKAAPATADGEWHTEANVQASVVTALAARGYRILSVANTATKEHGIDVIASHEGTKARPSASRSRDFRARTTRTLRAQASRSQRRRALRPATGTPKQCSPPCASAARNRTGGALSHCLTSLATETSTPRPTGLCRQHRLTSGGSTRTAQFELD